MQIQPAIEADLLKRIFPTLAYWIVMREEVFARGQSYDQQKQTLLKLNKNSAVNYESEASIIDVATVALAHHAMTGRCYLGTTRDWNYIKTYGRATYCRVKETVIQNEKRQILGFELSKTVQRTYQVTIGGFISSIGKPNLKKSCISIFKEKKYYDRDDHSHQFGIALLKIVKDEEQKAIVRRISCCR